MNLLTVGAGGHGSAVKETAEATGQFQSTSFLDDDNPDAIGWFGDYEAFRGDFEAACCRRR